MRVFRFASPFLLVCTLASVGWTQATVTSSDLARLETTAGEIDKQVATLRETDATLADEVEAALVLLRDDLTYLRVKLRREETVTRTEYARLRDQFETLRVRATPEPATVGVRPASEEPMTRVWTVPVGTELDVRLQTPLDSETANVEDRFEATTLLDYTMGRDVVIPAGSTVRGFVSSVRAAGRIDRRGSLTLSFDQLRILERNHRLRASVVEALDGKVSGDAARIGAASAAGAIIGGLLGGGKGALIGVLVGGGGTIASTEGEDVRLAVGTVLRIRIDQPVEITIER